MPHFWLSILIPVYNVEAYLQECVESVMAQADENVEILLLDDCSTDGSAALMQALSDRWPGRLGLLRHTQNQGLSAARNTMIEAAQGDYLWFLDSDDKLLPGAVGALKGIVRSQQPDLVMCDFQLWRHKPTLRHRLRGEWHRPSFQGLGRMAGADAGALLQGLLEPGQLHAWSKISRRALWTPDLRFPPDKSFEDMATMPRMALRAQTFYYEPSVWVAYRQRAGSILATMNLRKATDLSQALRLFCEEWRHSPLAGDARVAFALAHLSARNFIGAMRCLQRENAQQTAPEHAAIANAYRQEFLLQSPLSPRQLLQAYAQRFWWLRRHRFYHCYFEGA